MTEREDHRLVDYLYDELSKPDAEAFERAMKDDPSLASDAHRLKDVLSRVRSVEDEEPSLHLDSLLLANARQLAEENAKGAEKVWWRKLFATPWVGLAAAGSVAVLLAVITVPQLREPSEPRMIALESPPPPSSAETFGHVAPAAPDPAKQAGEALLERDAREQALEGATAESRRYVEFPAEQAPKPKLSVKAEAQEQKKAEIALRDEAADLDDRLVARKVPARSADGLARARPAAEPSRAPASASVAVGSSRVDLQACKLEYSIVSPK